MKDLKKYLMTESLNFKEVYDTISVWVGDEELEHGKESGSIYDVIDYDNLWGRIAKDLLVDTDELIEFVQNNDSKLSKKFKLC